MLKSKSKIKVLLLSSSFSFCDSLFTQTHYRKDEIIHHFFRKKIKNNFRKQTEFMQKEGPYRS